MTMTGQTTGETTFYAAVGIPQGLITDPETAESAGAVRRGGELVSLAPDDYDLWTCLGIPISRTALDEAAAARGCQATHGAIERLTELSLVLTLDIEGSLDGQIGYLRPVPRGVGIGNLASEPGIYQIKDAAASQSPAVSVDAVGIMLWWEFDGSISLKTAMDNVAKRLPELPRMALERLAVVLLMRLMAQRLIYLDTARDI
jgi:hypothetical protein